MKLEFAAELIQRGYDRDLGNMLANAPLDKNGVEAYLLTDGTLVIPGTNDTKDWRRNLTTGAHMRGASRRTWHKGFLEHARVVFAYAAPLKPKRVIGHSLGAAASQIIAVSLRIPAICFASPRPLRGSQHFVGEDKILNINRYGDDLRRRCRRAFGFAMWVASIGSAPVRSNPKAAIVSPTICVRCLVVVRDHRSRIAGLTKRGSPPAGRPPFLN
ncbi:MAG: hypothetical protein AAGP08_06065 [Pseudomonadota bacterium]